MSTRLLGGVLRAGPLLPLRRGVREIRDYFHYRPRPGFKPREIVRGPFSSVAVARSLRERGVCILEGALAPEKLRAAREAFEDLFVDADGRVLGRTDVPETYSRVIDCAQHPLLAELVLDELILAAVEAYYARPIYVATTQANRLDPVEPFDGDSYQWHHDTKGKYVKTMWLLTDVRRDGQRMSYVAGSHTLRHRGTTYEDSRFADDHAKSLGEVVECVGPAGSVVVFDTNGIHRGNRNRGPRRDVLFGVYSAGRYLLGCRFEPERVGHLTEWQREVLERSQTPTREYR